jgi:hypothetical protein
MDAPTLDPERPRLFLNGRPPFQIPEPEDLCIVETVFREAAAELHTHAVFTQWLPGTPVREPFEATRPDLRNWFLVSITNMETGERVPDPTLDLPITSMLQVVASTVQPAPPAEPVLARRSRIRDRDPALESESELPSASRRRQDGEEHRGSAGDQPSEPSASERP